MFRWRISYSHSRASQRSMGPSCAPILKARLEMVCRLPRVLSWMVLCGVLVATVGCGGGGDSKTQLRVLQASPDAGAVDVLLDGTSFASGANYGTPTSYDKASSESHALKVTPNGSTT